MGLQEVVLESFQQLDMTSVGIPPEASDTMMVEALRAAGGASPTLSEELQIL